ncbi:hypothetical protein Q5P01_007989 [Channa striata]|uniref:Lamina-associated polypeptide 2 n=1 Tax=Channa striata TaxID=64152 RepID=A0AA88T2L5_CHASR|nr:hypothetical protein Q5P01_007989 [Channa striata]
MPQFVEDPAYLSKSRLKSDLVAHDVALPPARSKKQVYVELHKKHIDQKTSADFSSDEEDRAEDGAEEDPELPDPGILTDDGLQAELLKHGVKAGPIVASTRALYEKKLRQLLQSDRQDRLNGAEKGVLYSDSEEEEEKEQKDDADSDSEGKEQTMEQSDRAQQASRQDLVKDTVRDLATRRRPIKGAAGRPVQYVYPDSPASPLTLERRETERRLVPVHIQILVFIVVACLLYLIYVCVEDNSLSPFVNLLESLSQGTEGEDRLLFQDKTQETPALSTQQ